VFGVGNNSQSAAATTFKPIVGDTEGHDSLLSENSSGLKLGQYPKDRSDTDKGPVQVNSHLTTNVSMLTPDHGRQ